MSSTGVRSTINKWINQQGYAISLVTTTETTGGHLISFLFSRNRVLFRKHSIAFHYHVCKKTTIFSRYKNKHVREWDEQSNLYCRNFNLEIMPDDIGLYRDKFLIAACCQLQLRAWVWLIGQGTLTLRLTCAVYGWYLPGSSLAYNNQPHHAPCIYSRRISAMPSTDVRSCHAGRIYRHHALQLQLTST